MMLGNGKRMFENRKGSLKLGKECSKTMLLLKMFSAKTNIFVHKLNSKIRVGNVTYTLNFTYAEKKHTYALIFYPPKSNSKSIRILI